MNFLTHIMHLAGRGATAYFIANQIRDSKTRPNVLAGLQQSESSSVPFLSILSDRAAKEGNTWLAEKLTKHALDETKHSRIFAHALKKLNKQIVNEQSKSETTSTDKPKQPPSPLFVAYFDGYHLEELKPAVIDWEVFLGSTYILELDSSKDYQIMAKVLPDNDLNTRNLKKGLLSIAQDEARHATYLYEAMMRRMSATQVQQLVDEWRTRKANAIFKIADSVFQKTDESHSLFKNIESSKKMKKY